MSILMVNEQFDFNSFKELLDLTDGNLASHLRNLENHAFVQMTKTFVGRKPVTRYSATEKGKIAFKEHLSFLENLIQENKG
jgi:DNA-binding HxlR family transcriptional regulator